GDRRGGRARRRRGRLRRGRGRLGLGRRDLGAGLLGHGDQIGDVHLDARRRLRNDGGLGLGLGLGVGGRARLGAGEEGGDVQVAGGVQRFGGVGSFLVLVVGGGGGRSPGSARGRLDRQEAVVLGDLEALEDRGLVGLGRQADRAVGVG